MQVTYCALWSDQRRAPTDVMSEEQARGLDRLGEPYAVVLGEPTAPDAVVEVAWKNEHLGVLFIDGQGRVHSKYSFRRQRDSRLFLSGITMWTYSAEAQFEFEADVVERITFRQDGYVRREIDDAESADLQLTEYQDVPMESNWELVPRFGDWRSVARYDRDASV